NIFAVFDNDNNFKFTINTKNGEKITTLFSSRAEPLVKRYKFIKGFEDSDEGYLDFYSSKKNNISNSKLVIDNFKVKEIPALAKLLSLASLQGIADLLTGEGIRFTDFEMNFTNNDKLMTIEELYAIGPAISILIEGYIEDNNLISLRGTLVPATTINRYIASIPLIGELLVGKKVGEGVFGVSFKVKGPPKKLETTVNPIKTLTPRFITRTLEKIKKN
ncbi:AsmA-like C-terminal region-containing protein, partial [Candidatus Pelagibacter bacterium]|nr:AsmA-like C-terminal region-containing protein [Candidatus Pelagibacter bacterium]